MSTANEQLLVDICFQLVLSTTDEKHSKFFEKLCDNEKALWIAEKLRTCGFDTYQCGASWGVLK